MAEASVKLPPELPAAKGRALCHKPPTETLLKHPGYPTGGTLLHVDLDRDNIAPLTHCCLKQCVRITQLKLKLHPNLLKY